MNAAVKRIEELVAPPFSSAKAAIRFAVTRFGRPSRPLMNTMGDKTPMRDSIGGLDAAAQAGMILQVLHRLGPVPMAALIAQNAPHSFECFCGSACCSGQRVNWEWREAIDTIARAAVTGARSKAPPPVRLAIVAKIYGEKTTFRRMAEQLESDVDVISAQYHQILRWLRGRPSGRNGEPAVDGLETQAMSHAESALTAEGIVG